jgi:hypothetical protein
MSLTNNNYKRFSLPNDIKFRIKLKNMILQTISIDFSHENLLGQHETIYGNCTN